MEINTKGKVDTNAANPQKKATRPKDYIPMSQAVEKLVVPEREGYNRRWFRGDPGRIAKAQRAGYTFVDASEVDLNNFDLGGDAKASGNTDLGTRVSVISGEGADETGQPRRLYLMECPVELYEHSRSLIEERNESIAATLRGDFDDPEADKLYVKTKMPDLFTPNKSKRRS